MAITITFLSSLSPDETRAKIAHAQQRYQDVLKHFWISEVWEAAAHDREDAAQYNFAPDSVFLIEWNKEEGSEFIPEIPQIMYEVFGRDKILVFDLNLDLIPPKN
jgi:hypothetical protein